MVLSDDDAVNVRVSRGEAGSAIVLVCEHASAHIPAALNDLGATPEALRSHVAWDPGAMAVAEHLSQALDAVLVSATVSRLVYDCNRPPTAPDAMPARSEAYELPGNRDLSDAARQARVARYYTPFRDRLAAEVARRSEAIVITVHSFTPVFHGVVRDVEIGILHDSDSRLADAMLQVAGGHDVRRNVPYGPEDGVTHTLREHAIRHGHLNVMIEVRNDLIADAASQAAMAQTLTGWISRALESLGVAACRA
ncbi:N-formylglutamate amidohydrolase [Jannaschia pohangensis]|uniref:Predicted N-formylglutamate amidohydrolase n=1 Tax=Jannaschia pohangensis TaxID=390807 RepID=A0A1I3ULK5_9RHOB|nr:N-formylglutamate amidohydrolase [Jannaschia pohangensis]SFJ82661.1 Predicted N-formylglutamate amidohydrolase [Jannaschia pohangensis]